MNFQVELHNFCQFTCGYCPNKDMERKRQFMTDEVWARILLDYILPFRHVNEFCPPTFIGHKDSEPLLDKNLPRRLWDLPPDMTIDIYSNGVLLPKWRDRGEDFIQFLASLPNRVRFMMSYHPANHDYSQNDYGPVVGYLKDALQDPPSNVEFITVSHRSKWVSDGDQENWRRVWEGWPITVHKNCSINPWTGRMADVATCEYHGCPYADFGHWFFGCTGNIIACCLDLEEEIVLGNVLTDDPVAVFTKTAAFYGEQRQRHAAGERPLHRVCNNCFGVPELIQVGT